MLYKSCLLAGLAAAHAFQAGAPMPLASQAASTSLQQLSMAAKQVPHGGTLVDLFAPAADCAGIAASADLTLDITERQSCDVELLCNGGLSPLTGFLNEEAYDSVVSDMKLPDGNILGLPIVMDTNDDSIKPGMKLLLRYDGTGAARHFFAKSHALFRQTWPSPPL